MYLGKLVETGPANDVYFGPVHPYTRGLIDTIPMADPVAEKAKVAKGVSGELPSAIDPPSGCRFRTRCPRAQEQCAVEEPPLRVFGDGTSPRVTSRCAGRARRFRKPAPPLPFPRTSEGACGTAGTPARSAPAD
jgi:oligopeptide/dipeptide ABC transporter ATP-binding protein